MASGFMPYRSVSPALTSGVGRFAMCSSLAMVARCCGWPRGVTSPSSSISSSSGQILIQRDVPLAISSADRGGEGQRWRGVHGTQSGSGEAAGFVTPELPRCSWCIAEEMMLFVKFQRMEDTICIVISAIFAVNKLGFLLLLAFFSCYRGGGRRGLEKWLGLWRQILLFLLFLELSLCGFACYRRRPDGRCWIGALLPPMHLLAVCKIPASALGGYCGDLNEVYSSIDPCRRHSYCRSSSSPVACRRRCEQWRIALCRQALEDLVVISILVRVLFVIWGQLPRIWMYSVCTLICD